MKTKKPNRRSPCVPPDSNLSRLLLFFLSFAGPLLLNAAQLAHKPGNLTVEQLQEDFAKFRTSLEMFHPALHWSIGEPELKARFSLGAESINEEMSEAQFYLMIRRIVASIGDGHLACDPPQGVTSGMIKETKLFPWKLMLSPSRAFLLCGDGAKPGVELLTLDGVKMEALIPRMLEHLPGDGAIQTKKLWSLHEGGFQFLYYWMKGPQETFRVEFRSKSGGAEVIHLPSTTLVSSSCFAQNRDDRLPLQLSFIGGIAVLKIGSFDINKLNDDPEFFPTFLKGVFQTIKERSASRLIIDLRNNPGGEDAYGALLYSFLADKPFAYYASLERVGHRYPNSAHSNLKIQEPASSAFLGKCYFLVNGKSFSTTAEFCAVARSLGRGLFIGEETGGAYRGNTGGPKEIVVLPHTKIKVIIPKRKYTLAVRPILHMDRGVIPDVEITPSFQDILQGKDVEMARALELAAEAQP